MNALATFLKNTSQTLTKLCRTLLLKAFYVDRKKCLQPWAQDIIKRRFRGEAKRVAISLSVRKICQHKDDKLV